MLSAQSASTLRPVQSFLKTVTGERAPIRGRTTLQFTIGSQRISQEVWVADIVDECLLGLDFLAIQECQVDLKDNILYIGGEEIPLTCQPASL